MTLGEAHAGFKIADDRGLDLKVEATATLASANVGPFSASVGLGVDTGLKIGDDGFGVKVR